MADIWNPHHYPIIEVIPGYITVYDISHTEEPTLAWCPGDETVVSADQKQEEKKIFRGHFYNFAYGSASLEPAHRAYLDAKIVPRVLEQGRHIDIAAAGGDIDMARRRAQAVYDFFISQRDVGDDAVGYVYQGIPPTSSTGRAVDRAVLIHLTEPSAET